MKKEEFLKKIKTQKSQLIVGLVLIIIGLVGSFIGYYFVDNMKTTKLFDVVEDGTYAELEITLMDNYFATQTIDGVEKRFYLVWDDNYAYVAVLNSDSFKALEEVRKYSMSDDENATKPEGVKVYGTAKLLPKEAIKYLKEWMPKEDGSYYTDEEILNYVGNFYIDTFDNNDGITAIIVIIGGICNLIGVVLIITYFIRSHKDKKVLSKYQEEIEKIGEAIEEGRATLHKICKTLVTDKYLISYQNGLKLIEISDVVWIYPFEYRQNGAVTQKSIYVITKNGKTNVFATTSAWGRKNKDAFNELYEELSNKLTNVLFGYTNENREKAKELYTKKK